MNGPSYSEWIRTARLSTALDWRPASAIEIGIILDNAIADYQGDDDWNATALDRMKIATDALLAKLNGKVVEVTPSATGWKLKVQS